MKVVIVGGGFGGVRAALNLARDPNFEVTLISKQTYFEYHAALYRSATGRSPLEVAILLSDFFANDSNIEVVQDEITGIDQTAQTVSSAGSQYHYDALILALGSVTQYFGIKGLPELSFGVKSIQEALELKRRLHDDLTKPKDVERNYVVIGGGPTGIELAGELVSYLSYVRRRHGVKSRFNVDLIEASPRLLPNLPESFTSKIQARLNQLGVKLQYNSAVKSETAEAIKLPRGEIKSHTVIWTAGVANNPLFARYPKMFDIGRGGKIKVNGHLEAVPSIYVIGDSAATFYSGMAQTAIHNANFVTSDLKRIIQGKARLSYVPKRPVYAIPAGPYWSAVLWGKLRMYGRAGWALRRLADLRLYLTFLPISKALAAWRYGFKLEESCPRCR